MLMLRRKLFGGRMLRALRWPDFAGACGVAAFAFGFMHGPNPIVLVAAIFAHMAARLVVRDPPRWWAVPAVATLIAVPFAPWAVVSGLGLGVFDTFARRGADPLGRAAAQWLLAAGLAFMWLAGRPQMDAVLMPALAGIGVAVVWIVAQRTIGSKAS